MDLLTKFPKFITKKLIGTFVWKHQTYSIYIITQKKKIIEAGINPSENEMYFDKTIVIDYPGHVMSALILHEIGHLMHTQISYLVGITKDRESSENFAMWCESNLQEVFRIYEAISNVILNYYDDYEKKKRKNDKKIQKRNN